MEACRLPAVIQSRDCLSRAELQLQHSNGSMPNTAPDQLLQCTPRPLCTHGRLGAQAGQGWGCWQPGWGPCCRKGRLGGQRTPAEAGEGAGIRGRAALGVPQHPQARPAAGLPSSLQAGPCTCQVCWHHSWGAAPVHCTWRDGAGTCCSNRLGGTQNCPWCVALGQPAKTVAAQLVTSQ